MILACYYEQNCECYSYTVIGITSFSFYFFLQMTTAISIEDVRREVKILKALSGHRNTVKFHDAFEDANNVYIVMEYVQPGFLFIHFNFVTTSHFETSSVTNVRVCVCRLER